MHTEPPPEGPQPVQGHDGTPPVEVSQRHMEVVDQAEAASTSEYQADKETQASIMDFEDGRAAAAPLNAIKTEEEISSSTAAASNMVKKRRIVQDVDENPRLNSNNNLKLEHVKPVIDDEDWGGLPWGSTLYGYFTGEQQDMDFSLFTDEIRNVWKAHGIEIEYIMKKLKCLYIFKFNTVQGMLDALEKRTWTVGDVQIILRRWVQLGKSGSPNHNGVLVWTKIYDMPHELWNMDVVNIIGSMLGNLLMVDICTRKGCTSAADRAEYARIQVDVGSSFTTYLVDEISVSFPIDNGYRSSNLRIEYTGICTYCKVFNHTDSNCIYLRNTTKEKAKEMRWIQQQEERKEKTRRLYLKTTIKVAVACDQDLIEQIGKDIYFDLVDHDKVWSFRVEKEMPFNSTVKGEVARVFGVPVEWQRFWTWAKRRNRTYRPYRSLTRLDEAQSVGHLRVVYNNSNAEAELNLFLERVIGLDLRPLPPPHISKQDILVFFKLYDPNKSQLRYVGRLYVRSCEKPTEIISKLNALAGFSPDEEIELYEEIKFERYLELDFDPCLMCERLDKRTSFGSSQITDGDIICFQKLPQAEAAGGDKYLYPDVPSFLEYVSNRKLLHFRSKDKPKEDAFSLRL